MRYSRTFFAVFFAILALFSTGLLQASAYTVQTDSRPDLGKIDAFLQAQVKANRIPGVAVAIVQGDQIVFEKGYGESVPGRSVTPQTRFYIGSVSKSFTALAAMQLVEQGKLNLDTPVRHYLSEFRVADLDASAKITLGNLLNHTSGLSDAGDPNVKVFTADLEEQTRLLKDARLTAPIGTRFQYYNQNYRVVGRMIEQASGQTYSNYIQDNIFKPLGMTHSTTNPAMASDLAQGYSRMFGFALPQTQRFNPGGLPSGYLISTAEDLAHFLIAQINNRQADGRPLLDAQSLAAMRTPPSGIDSNYAMGWLSMEKGNTLAMGGALEYYQCFIIIGLKEKTGLAILYNQNSLENMSFENNAIRDGLINMLNGKASGQTSFGWIGWLLLGLAALDLLNQARLFAILPRWVEKTANQNRKWLWTKVLVSILIPLAVIFGLPLVVKMFQGGSPNWVEPYQLMPDLVVWLLLGLSLNLIRNLAHAYALAAQATWANQRIK